MSASLAPLLTRSTSHCARRTIVRASNPGRDGPATRGVSGIRRRSAGGRACNSRSSFSSGEAGLTFRSSR
jgi:hypothetical protein